MSTGLRLPLSEIWSTEMEQLADVVLRRELDWVSVLFILTTYFARGSGTKK